MDESGQIHAPAASLPVQNPLCPSNDKLSGPQNRYRRGGEEKQTYPCRE